MLFFLREKARSRRCKLLTFVNVFLRNLLSFNLSILSFLSLSKELVINCLAKNANKIKNANKKTKLKMLKNASLFR
jgi:hypothetical protein